MFVSETSVTVRYAETDQMGVVYHANYLVWFELGRTDLIEKLGFNYAGMEKDGILSPVIDVSIRYKKPAVYGEQATVHTWIEAYDGLKVTYGYRVFNPNNDICVEGETQHICVRKESFKPLIMKKHYPDLDTAYRQAMATSE